MITKHRVFLNGEPLDGLDEDIVIQSVNEQAPQVAQTTLGRMGDGAWVTGEKRTALDVCVQFAIRDKRDLIHRRQVLERVTAWAAKGGWLELGYRPGQRLLVLPASLPAPGDVRVWNASINMSFRAQARPFWEATTETTQSRDSAGSLTINVPGTAKALLEADITAKVAIDQAAISCGGQSMAFQGLGMIAGDALHIAHDKSGRLMLTVSRGDSVRSVYACRTENSADELTLEPGANQVACTANASWTVRTRGRWL